jgi:hydrogenase/urease accessory protein HupE
MFHGANAGDEAISLLKIRTFAIGFFAGLAVLAAAAYYRLEIRGP